MKKLFNEIESFENSVLWFYEVLQDTSDENILMFTDLLMDKLYQYSQDKQ